MSPRNLFRCLVATSLILALVSLAVTHFPGQAPGDWQTVLEWNRNGSFIDDFLENRVLLFAVAAPLAILAIAAQIGMFFFWRLARPAYAAFAAFNVLLTPFWGLSVLLPVEAAFTDLSLLVEGAVIALSYSQPFSSYFEAA